MVRWFDRTLVLAAVIASVAAPAFADDKDASSGKSSTSVTSSEYQDRAMAADYERFRAKGYRDRDIQMAFNAARRTGRQPDEILSRLDRGQTWAQIAADLNLSERELMEPRMRTAGAREGTMGRSGDDRMSGSMGTRRWSGYSSRRYMLTPMEHKRLRAYGLSDRQVFLAANAAHLSGKDVDEIMQMIFRGHTSATLAEWLQVNPKALEERRPEWDSPEWKSAVEHGDTWPPMRTRSERDGSRGR
jgi:FixJ family two-component response regulator